MSTHDGSGVASETSMSRRPGVRWWPAVLIVAAAAALAAVQWNRNADVQQFRVLWVLSIAGATVILLAAWGALFSRLPAKARATIAVTFLSVVALGAATLRIDGVTGDLRPILKWRFAAPETIATSGDNVEIQLASTPSDFPQFLGPNRNSTLPDIRLDTDWQARPPKLLWRRPVGESWASFAIVGNYAITQEQAGQDEQIVCYEVGAGKPMWRYSYPAEFRTVIAGTGPRSTPTVVDGRVYAMGATGVLTCLDGNTGSKIWSRDTLADAGAENREWGVSCSPLVTGELVVVSVGGPNEAALAAYHRQTGERAWHAGKDYAGYSSPVLVTLCGVPQILIVSARSVTSHDPTTGQVLWEREWGSGNANCVNAIPIGDNRVFLSSGYGFGCVLLELAKHGDALGVEEVWPHNRNMKCKISNPVVHGEHLYGLDEGVLACLDLQTGKRLWRAGRYGHGQLLLVGDLILVQAESGDVLLVRPNPKKLEEVATLPALNDKTWNVPSLAGNLLLVRNEQEAAAFELPLAR